MNNLDDLIKAAEKRGAAERLLHAGERALGELGTEALAKGAQLDESGTLETARQTTRVVKTASDLIR